MNYVTIAKAAECSFREKGSKFLSYLTPIYTVEDHENFLAAVRKEHPLATHHCSAYRLGPNPIQEHGSDDGEPKGTAGLPILNGLKSKDVINVSCVVVRYFGGTKLGVRGLIEAYGYGATLGLETADLVELEEVHTFKIKFDYPLQSQVNTILHHLDIQTLESTYNLDVELELACPPDDFDKSYKSFLELEHLGLKAKDHGLILKAVSNN